MHELIHRIKQTRLGGAAAWLARPVKHYRDIRRHLERQLPYPPAKRQICWCFVDYLGFWLKYGGYLETDYFGAQMYRKSDFVRRDSLSTAVRFSWRDSVQDRESQNIFLDKREFYAAFSQELHRKWLAVDANTDWDVFSRFVESCSGQVFVKDPLGMGGRSVALRTADTEEKRRELFALCRKQPVIVEEVLHQCGEIHAFSNGAVNTLRVITIIDDAGDVHIARCELRMGRSGMDIDNYCSGGLAAQVDAESGVVYSVGRDENGGEYLFHPDSGKQIVGFAIPQWERYTAFARELAGRYPGMRYVGWDIVMDRENRLCVIEGNKDAGVGALESGLLYGLRPRFDALLRGDRSFPQYR